MSVIQMLVIDPDRRPDIAGIRQSASSEGIPYHPDEVDLTSHTGFLPVTIGDRDTGFEYYFAPIDHGQLPEEATQHGSHQMIARTGGDMAEMFASLLFLRTAAKLSGAAYVYLDDGIIIPPAEVDGYLSAQIDQVQKFLK